MNNVQLYWRLRCHPQDSDLRSALLLEQAAHCFINMKQPMVRKYSFHMILAGHRFSKAAQVNESFISSSLCSSCTKAFLYWVKTISLSKGLLGNSISFSYWVMEKSKEIVGIRFHSVYMYPCGVFTMTTIGIGYKWVI